MEFDGQQDDRARNERAYRIVDTQLRRSLKGMKIYEFLTYHQASRLKWDLMDEIVQDLRASPDLSVFARGEDDWLIKLLIELKLGTASREYHKNLGAQRRTQRKELEVAQVGSLSPAPVRDARTRNEEADQSRNEGAQDIETRVPTTSKIDLRAVSIVPDIPSQTHRHLEGEACVSEEDDEILPNGPRSGSRVRFRQDHDVVGTRAAEERASPDFSARTIVHDSDRETQQEEEVSAQIRGTRIAALQAELEKLRDAELNATASRSSIDLQVPNTRTVRSHFRSGRTSVPLETRPPSPNTRPRVSSRTQSDRNSGNFEAVAKDGAGHVRRSGKIPPRSGLAKRRRRK